MFDKELLEKYYLIEDNKYIISRLYCISCVKASLQYYDPMGNTLDEEVLQIASAVYDEYLDCDYLQISKISDILVEHWEEYLNNEDFDITHYE